MVRLLIKTRSYEHRLLLRARRERPPRRTSDRRNELAPFHGDFPLIARG